MEKDFILDGLYLIDLITKHNPYFKFNPAIYDKLFFFRFAYQSNITNFPTDFKTFGLYELKSEKMIVSPESKNIFDYLGLYTFPNGINKEGKILIFNNRIYEYSGSIKSEYFNQFPNITQDVIYNYIFKIVLWHEMGHWASHWLLDKNNNRWNNNNYRYVNQNDYDLHEGLAQAFTHWAIQFYNSSEYPLLNTIYNIMTLTQAKQYRTYHQIISKDIKLYEFLDAISEIRKITHPPILKDLLDIL